MSEREAVGQKREQASGHEFALKSLAQIRTEAKRYVQLLNATDDVAPNAIFLPLGATAENHPHSRAHSAVMAYLNEMTKPSYLSRAGVEEFVNQQFTSIQIPEKLAKSTTVTIEVESPEEKFDPASADLDMVDWAVSLDTLDWWWGRFVTIEKVVDSPYYSDKTESDYRKVVLPPRVLAATFKRLDNLAAELGVLLQIQEGTKNAAGEYTDVDSIDKL